MDLIKNLRGKTSTFKRLLREFLDEAPRSRALLDETHSRLEYVDRRFAQLEQDVRKALPVDHEFSGAGIELFSQNVLAINQGWPRLSTVFSGRITPDSLAPIPPLASRARIQGAKCVGNNPEDGHFLNSGVSDLRAVFNIAGVFGVDLDRELSVLDFGVGCARMARHLPPNARGGFVGVDVDTVNIAWCAGNMPFGRYEAIVPHSAISAPDRSFDLIYSHSVFTHLLPLQQNHWLKELGRVSRGLIIVSVHGLYSCFKNASWSRDPKYLANWLRTGFVDAGVPNPDISDVVDKEYYRDVAHAPAYIKRDWSAILDVVEIIPGGFGNVHDAIVLRRRGE